jgi:hypothetical protein
LAFLPTEPFEFFRNDAFALGRRRLQPQAPGEMGAQLRLDALKQLYAELLTGQGLRHGMEIRFSRARLS